jgi:hypothetical protein
MNFSMHCFRTETAAAVAVLLVSVLFAEPASAQRRDYFTELEIANIQEAQEIGYRTEVLLGIAARRLALAGLIESDERDPSAGPGFGGKLGRALITILNPAAAEEIKAVEDERAALDHDLSGHSRADLLRGYSQALDETMDNIDDAYERNRGDITGSLENLRDFTETSRELLLSAEPESGNEEDAVQDAIEQTELAFEGARDALETIPRNER